jgi:hypothetical protein
VPDVLEPHVAEAAVGDSTPMALPLLLPMPTAVLLPLLQAAAHT